MDKKGASKTILQLVSFALDKEIFALDVMKIKGIERMSEITAIPKYPSFVEGVINLRDEIIPIVDMRKKFGLPPVEHTKETRIILIELENMTLGLVVDRVFEVFQLYEGEIGQMPNLGHTAVGQQFVVGVVKMNNKLIVILNMDRLFTEEETMSLSNGV